MYALILNGAVAKYPYPVTDARRDNPNVSFPANPDDEALQSVNAFPVQPVSAPSITASQALVEGTPVLLAGQWTQVWSVRAKTAAELAAELQALQANIVDATQLRLDTFAQTRNYMGILSASTYATSAVLKFKTEGQYCVNQRDATWAKLYQILAQVQAGTRPMPTGYADIEAELPVLVWP